MLSAFTCLLLSLPLCICACVRRCVCVCVCVCLCCRLIIAFCTFSRELREFRPAQLPFKLRPFPSPRPRSPITGKASRSGLIFVLFFSSRGFCRRRHVYSQSEPGPAFHRRMCSQNRLPPAIRRDRTAWNPWR